MLHQAPAFEDVIPPDESLGPDMRAALGELRDVAEELALARGVGDLLYWDERTELPPEGVTYDPYTVAMANTGRPNSNGSQFFVCLVDLDDRLQRTYSIFGTVTEGRDVVDAIGQVEVRGVTGVPVDPVVINGITPVAAESTPS